MEQQEGHNIIRTLRGRIVNALRMVAASFGSLLIVVTVYLDWLKAAYIPMSINLILFGTLMFVLFSRKFGIRVRSTAIVFIVYFISINAFFNAGVLGGGRFWLIVTTSLAGVLLGRTAAFISFGFAISTVMAVNIYHYFGGFSQPAPVTDTWLFILDSGLDVTLMTVLTALPATLLLRALEKVYLRERNLRVNSETLNDQLIDSNKSLRTLNDTIANDLNPHLRKVIFNVNMLEESLPTGDSESKVFIGKLQESLNHINILVQDSQYLSMIANSSLEKIKVNLASLLEQTATRLNETFGDNFLINSPDEASINADPRLMRIFLNDMLLSLFHYRDNEVKIELDMAIELRDTDTIYHFSTNKLFLEKKELESQEDEFVPFYSPFIPKDADINGTRLIVAQQVIYLHGGAFKRFEVVDGCFELTISLPASED